MNDSMQRPLSVGDRITIPATVESIGDGVMSVKPLLPENADLQALQIAPNSALRCMDGDNNGIDDAILGDQQVQIRAHYDAEMASFDDAHAARMKVLDDQYAQAQASNAQRIATMDAEYEVAKAVQIARMSVVNPPAA